MKTRNFLMAFAAIATVSMSSCSQEEEVVTPDSRLSDNAIAFSTYIGKNPASRGSILNTAALKESEAGFGVFAYYTQSDNFDASSTSQTPNFMYNQQVRWSANTPTTGDEATSAQTDGDGDEAGATQTNGSWTYSPLKYWPNNDGHKISFFAYAPYATPTSSTTYGITELSSATATGAPTLKYVMTSDVSKHIDLLYADANGNGNTAIKDLTKSSSVVNFNFKHALSRISFYRQALIDGNAEKALDGSTKITITKVTFKAVDLATEGTLNLSTGNWSNLSYGTMTYELNFDTDTSTETNTETNTETKANVLTSDNATTVTELVGESGHIMFIPVAKPESTPETTPTTYSLATRAGEETAANTSTSTITIEYEVETTDNNLQNSKSTVTNKATVNVPTLTLTSGKAYNFLLKIGMNSVQLSAEVTDWPDMENENNTITWDSDETSGSTGSENEGSENNVVGI